MKHQTACFNVGTPLQSNALHGRACMVYYIHLQKYPKKHPHVEMQCTNVGILMYFLFSNTFSTYSIIQWETQGEGGFGLDPKWYRVSAAYDIHFSTYIISAQAVLKIPTSVTRFQKIRCFSFRNVWRMSGSRGPFSLVSYVMVSPL